MSGTQFSRSSEVAHLVAEIRRMTIEEALEIYGVEIHPDKTVFDTAYEEEFKNLNEWAAFVVSQEMDEWEDKDEDTSKWSEEE